MRRLDRNGIFRARPLSWSIRTNDKSQSVAVSIDFEILEQLDGNAWVSWADYEEHQVSGDFYVIKKDGSINTPQVEQLAKSLGWSGDLRAVGTSRVPDVVVQVSVKADVYNGKTRFKADWINPGDFEPSGGASDQEVGALQTRFGSLLRAAAAGALPQPAAHQRTAAARPQAPPPASAPVQRGAVPAHDETDEGENIPF